MTGGAASFRASDGRVQCEGFLPQQAGKRTPREEGAGEEGAAFSSMSSRRHCSLRRKRMWF